MNEKINNIISETMKDYKKEQEDKRIENLFFNSAFTATTTGVDKDGEPPEFLSPIEMFNEAAKNFKANAGRPKTYIVSYPNYYCLCTIDLAIQKLDNNYKPTLKQYEYLKEFGEDNKSISRKIKQAVSSSIYDCKTLKDLHSLRAMYLYL